MLEDMRHQPFIIRHYIPPGDIPSLSRLLTAIEEHDLDGEDTSEAALQAQLGWPHFDPEHDCQLIETTTSPHALIGYSSVYAQTQAQSTLSIAIHPAWRRRGLGSALLRQALVRAQATGADEITIYTNAHNAASNSFLQKYGFSLAGSAWTLGAPAGLPLEETQWPDGYTVSDYTVVADPALLAEAFNRSYSDLWGHSENTAAATEQGMATWASRRNPDGVFLVFGPDGKVIGTCTAINASETDDESDSFTDIIDAPGLAPEQRTSMLYRPLVLTAMRWLRSQANHAITLQSWGDSEQTIAIFQQLGFVVTQRYLAYRHNCGALLER